MTVHRQRRVRSIDKRIDDLSTHPSEFVTVAVVAEYLECDERKVYRLISDGKLAFTRPGREYRIAVASIRKYFTPVVSRGTARAS